MGHLNAAEDWFNSVDCQDPAIGCGRFSSYVRLRA